MRTSGKYTIIAGLILSFLGTTAMASDRHHVRPKHPDEQTVQTAKDNLQHERDGLSAQRADAGNRASQARNDAAQAHDRASSAASQAHDRAGSAASEAHDRANSAASEAHDRASSAASEAHDRASSAASEAHDHGIGGSAGGFHR
ncbi:hypothetical protein [Agrobacterium sp. NPDC089420]|uniref:hypothetical protein n=1 Tax=Agrobacterium sp. NPDC089420 TaxID=3363918 RepID=UPI0038509B68